MAFARSRVMHVVKRYNSAKHNPYQLDASKMTYNKENYRQIDYWSKWIEEGYNSGSQFLSRIPRYRSIHPEIMDKIDAQRTMMCFTLLGIFFSAYHMVKARNGEDAQFNYDIHKDKDFIGRYSYNQRDVEYQGPFEITPPSNTWG